MTDKPNHNLAILGLISVVIALTTTSISILIYHNSGDIYLDRSRPGFLPDEKEVEEESREDYSFSETDPLSAESLDDYLEHYQETLNDLDKIESPFNAGPLSDEALGIPEKSENPE